MNQFQQAEILETDKQLSLRRKGYDDSTTGMYPSMSATMYLEGYREGLLSVLKDARLALQAFDSNFADVKK